MATNADLMDLFDESRELFGRIGKKIGGNMNGRWPSWEFGLMKIMNHLGRAKLKDIAKFVGAKPLVCLRLGALERKKYIIGERDEADRRNVYYHIAPAGEAFLKQEIEAVKESMRGVLAPLDAKDAADLFRAVTEMNRILEKVV
jgi:DNA-binding MarR family transcriptional regulator